MNINNDNAKTHLGPWAARLLPSVDLRLWLMLFLALFVAGLFVAVIAVIG